MNEEARQARNKYFREYRKKNPEKVKEYRRKWRKENREKVKQYQERYWEKKLKNEKEA
ncbi:hypothetical protein [Paenibacillus sp. FSL H7-0326]|uniref:hypothetical protein n=1 Tax=Paenibacillus sp. FSL H7-0326 TaxID=1921144 RepID=UPI0015C2D6DA|nr:hypothetical protein [Paenibacillus sp. FSL H7-0326]